MKTISMIIKTIGFLIVVFYYLSEEAPPPPLPVAIGITLLVVSWYVHEFENYYQRMKERMK